MTQWTSGVLIGALVAFWIASPLRGRHRALVSADQETADLIEAKEAIYRSILDLEFDLKTGKAQAAEYPAMRRRLEGEAIAVLRRLETTHSPDDLLELEIAAARRRLEN